jgi:hypothetical protein
MSMSRKHYQQIATIIDNTRNEFAGDSASQAAIKDIAEGLASMFKQDNGSFSYTQFFDACGLPVPSRFAGAR